MKNKPKRRHVQSDYSSDSLDRLARTFNMVRIGHRIDSPIADGYVRFSGSNESGSWDEEWPESFYFAFKEAEELAGSFAETLTQIRTNSQHGLSDPEKELLLPIIQKFNEITGPEPIRLGLDIDLRPGRVFRPYAEGVKSERGDAFRDIWFHYFLERGWERLKRCAQCEIWFVDRSKSRTGKFCSERCTNRWWSREKRREAGHGGTGETRKRPTKGRKSAKVAKKKGGKR